MALDRTWYNTLVNDDGSNTIGSPWEKEDVDALMDAIDAEVALVAPFPILNGTVFHSAVQAVGTGAFVACLFDSEDYDTAGLHSTVTNTSRVTIVTPGTYEFVGKMTYAGNATGQRQVNLRLNGTTYIEQLVFPNNGAALVFAAQVVRTIPLVANDYLELVAYQDSGVSLNIGFAGARYAQNSLAWRRVG